MTDLPSPDDPDRTRPRDGRHAGRVVVVTGAAGGIGRAYAERFAAEGATVVVVDVRDGAETCERVRALGPEPLSARCDVSDEDDVAALAQTVRERLGRCDVLVNNAAIRRPGMLETHTFADWRATLSVNLDGAFLMCRAFAPLMRERGYGRIVNISSNTVGIVITGCVSYVTTKAGLIGLTRELASELGAAGITVNAVLPGLTRTEGTEAAAAAGALSFEEMALRQAIPRPGEPDDLVGVVSFLASEDAAFVTGQAISVDGGLLRR